jgi:hypothetical protein
MHIFGQVRSLAHNLIFKIWSELIVRHTSSILGVQRKVEAMIQSARIRGVLALEKLEG